MKSKTFAAMAVASAFACSTGAFAGNTWNGYEVRTPSAVDESAPWLANEPHMPGMASTMTFASAGSDRIAADAPLASGASPTASGTNTAYTEYWLLGAEGSDIGASSGASGTGSVAFDSSSMAGGAVSMHSSPHYGLTTSPIASSAEFDSAMNRNELMSYSFEPAASAFEMVLFTPSAEQVIGDLGDATPLLSEHYLIAAPDSAYDPSELVVLMVGPASEDVALLDSLKEHFIVLTPAYGEA
jgi:hypothetical protein